MTGSGKSTVARAIGQSARVRQLLIDPSDSEVLARWPGVHTIHAPSEWRPDEHWTARYVPEDPGDLDAYDELYRRVYLACSTWVLCDEAGEVIPSNRRGRWQRKVLVQGRKRGIGHLAAHTRPIEVDRNIIGQAQHVLVWDLPVLDDRRLVANQAGVRAGDFDRMLDSRRDPAFLWINRRARTVTVCPPVPV